MSAPRRELWWRLRIALAAYALWLVSYEAVGAYTATLPAFDPSLPLDARIPFAPEWVYVYELTYVLPLLAIFAIEDGVRFVHAVLAIGVAAALAFIVYVTLPASFERPELGSSLAERVLTLERGLASAQTNQLPSLHVANALIVAWAVRGPRLGWAGSLAAWSLALAIAASTLLVKQHVLADVVAGAVLAPVAWGIAGRYAGRWSRLGARPLGRGLRRSA